MKNYILEHSSYYRPGDIILIEYWYNNMITPVKIVDKIGRKYLISHNIKESKIFNAPDEIIPRSDIIDKFNTKNGKLQ